MAVESVDVREIDMLRGSSRWTEAGLQYKARDKHYQASMEGLGFGEKSKTVNSAAVKPEKIGKEEDEEMMEGTEKTSFRSLESTLNYMSLDRSDVEHAAKEVCTKMANPTSLDT